MSAAALPRTLRLAGSGGLELAADRWAAPDGPPVVLLHGGGQTRHAWGETGATLASLGYDVTSLDLRGHGDSAWATDGDYRMDAFRDDLRAVLTGLSQPAVLIGASLGGVAALLATGEAPASPVRAVVLVDITPEAEPEGIARIQAFMTANTDGFVDVEEAALAVAGYLPHRPRAPNLRGLMKNLRERDGRLYWHWDPSFLAVTAADRNADGGRLERAARALSVPTLLVRGSDSDIVSPRAAEGFLRLVPHAEMVEVAGAAHMVAGDQNTPFGTALTGFLQRSAPALSIDRRLSQA